MPKLIPFQVPAKSYDVSEADEIIFLIESALSGKTNCIALGILNCIQHKVPSWKLIKEIQEMINDNYTDMSRMFGGSLTVRIKSFES